MREEIFTLRVCDNVTLYGRLNRAEEAQKAVVLCHGLTGHMYEHHFQLARMYFTERGYDVIRVNFYSCEKDARCITDCTVALHAQDLSCVLRHFAPQYRSIYIAGHSFGGLAILMANLPQVAAASFWDGTFIPFAEDKGFSCCWHYNRELDEYIVDWPPVKRVVGKKFYEETQTFTTERMAAWAKAFTRPAQVVAAGAFAENMPYQRKFFETLTTPKEFALIEGASHGFNEGNTVFQLLDSTYCWFEKFKEPHHA